MTVAALAAGDQVLILRKGGIGEKRFELPHPRFYLFPTYAHQRPELVIAGRARALRRPAGASATSRRGCRCRPTPSCTRPTRSPTPRRSRARRPPHPLALLRRAERLQAGGEAPALGRRAARLALPEPPVLEVAAAYGGCVSWVELPGTIGAPAERRPALDDDAFAAGRGRGRGGPRGRRGRALTRAHVLVCRGPECAVPRRPGRLHGARRTRSTSAASPTRSPRPSAAAWAPSAAAAPWSAATRPGPGTPRSPPADAAEIVGRTSDGGRGRGRPRGRPAGGGRVSHTASFDELLAEQPVRLGLLRGLRDPRRPAAAGGRAGGARAGQRAPGAGGGRSRLRDHGGPHPRTRRRAPASCARPCASSTTARSPGAPGAARPAPQLRPAPPHRYGP